jgi:6-phosphogluconolactonase (cycloisomerase 2 family)
MNRLLNLVFLFLFMIPVSLLSACGSGGGGGGGTTITLTYGTTAVTLARGVQMSELTPMITGTATSYSVTSGSLPVGVSLDTTTGVLSGTPTATQAAAAATIEVMGASTTDSVSITFTVDLPYSRTLYAANNNDNVIGVFSVDPNTGRLNARGDVSGLVAPASMAYSNDLQYLYAANATPGTLSGFAIDAATGDLTELAGSPFAMSGGAALQPNRIAMQPNGSTMYVTARLSGQLSMFDIGAGGALTEKAGSPFGTFAGARDVRTVQLPVGNFLYVTAPNEASNRLISHSIATDGTLTQIDADTTGTTPTAMTATPAGDFLYLVNEGSLTVSGYVINQTDGTLTELAGSPFAIAGTGTAPADIVMTDDGTNRFIYVPSVNGEVSMFSVDGAGALTLLSPATVSGSGGLMTGMAAAPNGESVYACDTTAREILSYSVGFGGLLTEHLEIPIIRSQGRMREMVVLPSATLPVWNTNQLYATNVSGNSISTFDVDSSTKMMTAQSPLDATVSIEPEEIAISKDGTMLYITHPGDATAPLMSVPINPDGSLDTTSATAVAGNNASFVEIDPSGDFLYVVDGSGQTLRPYPLDSAGLIGTAGASLPTGNLPLDVALDPTGRFAYVTNFGDDTISQYSINLVTGALSAMTPATVGSAPGPLGIVVHPSGRFAYASCVDTAGPNADLLVAYDVNATTGALTTMTPAFQTTGADPGSMVITPDGQFLIVANTHSSSSTISSHLINDFAITAVQDGELDDAMDLAATTTQPQSVAISKEGGAVYVGINVGTGVEAFTVGATGLFTSLDAEATGGVIRKVLLSESRD